MVGVIDKLSLGGGDIGSIDDKQPDTGLFVGKHCLNLSLSHNTRCGVRVQIDSRCFLSTRREKVETKEKLIKKVSLPFISY